MAEIEFRLAWGRNDAAMERDAKGFWRALDALPPEEIDERAKQLCAVAYEAGGKVVAVSTVHLQDFPRLRSRFFYYRTTVDPGHRRQRLASRLCVYSRDRLNEWAREHPEEKLKGLFILIEAEEFRGRQHVPVAKQLDLDLILVGYTPTGYQMRIVWFKDATVE
jgi:GNAT superfamily N-acetyltransferase